MSQKNPENLLAEQDQQQRSVDKNKTTPSSRRNWTKKMEMDRAHITQTSVKHHQTGSDLEPSREEKQRTS